MFGNPLHQLDGHRTILVQALERTCQFGFGEQAVFVVDDHFMTGNVIHLPLPVQAGNPHPGKGVISDIDNRVFHDRRTGAPGPRYCCLPVVDESAVALGEHLLAPAVDVRAREIVEVFLDVIVHIQEALRLVAIAVEVVVHGTFTSRAFEVI